MVILENAIMKRGDYLDVTRDEVVGYLNEVKKSVEEGRYQISPRTKNQSLYIDYVFSEQRCKEILLDLEADDFSEAVQNDHPQHPEEILYIFGKDVIVISFHKQDYPLVYKFK